MGGTRILVVDDEEYVRKMFKRMLESEGWEVLTAESGEAALDVFEKEEVDIILLDVNMPGMKGPECLVKCKEQCRDIPVIIISVEYDEDIIRETMTKGADNYLRKPVSKEILLSAIEKALNRQS